MYPQGFVFVARPCILQQHKFLFEFLQGSACGRNHEAKGKARNTLLPKLVLSASKRLSHCWDTHWKKATLAEELKI